MPGGLDGISWSFINSLKNRGVSAPHIARLFSVATLGNYTGSVYSGLSVSLAGSYLDLAGAWGDIGTNVQLGAFLPNGHILLTNAVAKMSIGERINLLVQSFEGSAQGAGYSAVGVLGSGKGFLDPNTVKTLFPGAKLVNICICGNCVGFNQLTGKHQVVTVVFANDSTIPNYFEPDIPNHNWSPPPGEFEGSSVLHKDGGEIFDPCATPPCDKKEIPDCVTPPCTTIPQFLLPVAMFAIKRFFEANKSLSNMSIGTHIRGNMARQGPFMRPRNVDDNNNWSDWDIQSWWDAGETAQQYYNATVENHLIISNHHHGSTSASDIPPHRSQVFPSHYEPQHILDRSGVPHLPFGVPLSVQAKVNNNVEYKVEDVFTVTHYIDIANTDPIALEDAYLLVKEILGKSWHPAVPSRYWSFELDFSSSTGYAFEQKSITANAPGRWKRMYRNEPYFPTLMGVDYNGYELYNLNVPYNSGGGMVAINGLTPQYIISNRSIYDPPDEYLLDPEEGGEYFWRWDDLGGPVEAEISVCFSKGYRLTYPNTHSSNARITYFGETSSFITFKDETSIMRDTAQMLISYFALAAGPPGWVTLLANFLVGLIPNQGAVSTERAQIHHFAVQWSIPYKLYYGAWTDPGTLELKPYIKWRSPFTASRAGGQTDMSPRRHETGGFDPMFPLNGTVYGGGYQWGALEEDGMFPRKEYNYPSCYYLTKTELNIPHINNSGAIQVIKGSVPDTVQMPYLGTNLYGFSHP